MLIGEWPLCDGGLPIFLFIRRCLAMGGANGFVAQIG